jgi:hypothetical protein
VWCLLLFPLTVVVDGIAGSAVKPQKLNVIYSTKKYVIKIILAYCDKPRRDICLTLLIMSSVLVLTPPLVCFIATLSLYEISDASFNEHSSDPGSYL